MESVTYNRADISFNGTTYTNMWGIVKSGVFVELFVKGEGIKIRKIDTNTLYIFDEETRVYITYPNPALLSSDLASINNWVGAGSGGGASEATLLSILDNQTNGAQVTKVILPYNNLPIVAHNVVNVPLKFGGVSENVIAISVLNKNTARRWIKVYDAVASPPPDISSVSGLVFHAEIQGSTYIPNILPCDVPFSKACWIAIVGSNSETSTASPGVGCNITVMTRS